MIKANNLTEFLLELKSMDQTFLNRASDKVPEYQEIITGFFSGLDGFVPAFYVLDYLEEKFLYANHQISRIVDGPVSDLMDGGLNFALGLLHKNDLKIQCEKVFASNLNFLKTITPDSYKDYLFTTNYRIRTINGNYKNIIQQSVIICSSPTGAPLVSLGFLFDVSSYFNSAKIIHTIEKLHYDKEGMITLKRILFDTYIPDEINVKLSNRELEILKYVCNDWSSEEIARKIYISKHTVNNHRKKLLEKTNTHSTVGLVKFAYENGYI